MSINADAERRFYDREYSRHLSQPDDALRFDRAILLADLNDPSRAIYERRRLFQMTFDFLSSLDLKQLSVLDYGCGAGEWGCWMATEGARVTFLDLSPAAVNVAMRRARASGAEERVRGEARDASDLSGIPDGAYDLIFGCAAVHHTLKYPNAFQELLRVLKPGGWLVLAETLGDNPILNLGRKICARWNGISEDAGEEIILGRREIDLLRNHFQSVQVMPVNLLGMAKRMFRGHFTNPGSQWILGSLESIDGKLLKLAPSLRGYCGEALIVAVK
jgi:SAM-dependent methyltransferase